MLFRSNQKTFKSEGFCPMPHMQRLPHLLAHNIRLDNTLLNSSRTRINNNLLKLQRIKISAHLTNIIIEYVNKKNDKYSQSHSIQIPPSEGGCRLDPENKQTPQQEKTVGNKPTRFFHSRIPAFFILIPYSPVHKTALIARGCRRQKTSLEHHYHRHSGR